MEKIDKIIYFLILAVSVIVYFIFKENSLVPLIILNIAAAGLFAFKIVKKDVFSMGVLLLLNYCMYVLYIPVKQINKNYKVEFYIDAMNRSLGVKILLICGIVAVISYVFGYYAAGKLPSHTGKCSGKGSLWAEAGKVLKRLKGYKYGYLLNRKILADFLMSAGTIIFLYGIHKQGGLSYLFSKYVWNSENVALVGIMTTGAQVAYAGIAISLYLFLDKRIDKIWDFTRWNGLYFMIFLTLIKLIQGGRIQILMGFLSILTIFHYKHRRFRLKEVLAAGALGYVIFGYIGYFRDFKTLMPKDFGTMVAYMMGGSGGMEYFLNSYTSFTMMNIISTHNISYLWGTSLLDGIIFLIPRAFMQNKEQVLFLSKKLEELNKIEIVSPVGGLNLAAQNLMNGYVVYTIIFMFLLGAVTFWMAKKRDSLRDGVLFYSLVLPILVVSLVRNPIFYTIKELIQFAILPFIVFRLLQYGGQNVKDNI